VSSTRAAKAGGTGEGGGGLGADKIIGIVCSILGVLLGIAGCFGWSWKQKRKGRETAE